MQQPHQVQGGVLVGPDPATGRALQFVAAAQRQDHREHPEGKSQPGECSPAASAPTRGHDQGGRADDDRRVVMLRLTAAERRQLMALLDRMLD